MWLSTVITVKPQLPAIIWGETLVSGLSTGLQKAGHRMDRGKINIFFLLKIMNKYEINKYFHWDG